MRIYSLKISDSHDQPSRWDQASKVLAEIADAAVQYDKDGVDIQFLNSKTKGEGLKVCLLESFWFSSQLNNACHMTDQARNHQSVQQRKAQGAYPHGREAQ